MKHLPLIIAGIFFSFCLYVFTSMYNHTWNAMAYTNDSVATMSIVFMMLWLFILLVTITND